MKQHHSSHILVILYLIGILFSATGCMKPKLQSFPELEMEPDQLHRQVTSGFDMEIYDLRAYEEYRTGHIPGAKFMPPQDIYQDNELITQVKPVILYCNTGSTSLLTARMLAEKGYKNVEILKGGFKAWIYEIEK